MRRDSPPPPVAQIPTPSLNAFLKDPPPPPPLHTYITIHSEIDRDIHI